MAYVGILPYLGKGTLVEAFVCSAHKDDILEI